MGSKPLVRPPRLARGSRIALVAPAGPLLERDDLTPRRGALPCAGLRTGPGRACRRAHGYLAGTDDERLADLNAALARSRDRCRLVHSWRLRRDPHPRRRRLRGARAAAAPGHRTTRDITALLLGVIAPGGHRSPFTARPPGATCRPSADATSSGCSPAPRPAGAARAAARSPPACWCRRTNRDRHHPAAAWPKGRSWAATSRLLQCLIGTPYFPDLDGAILFLEDVNEDLYRVDRMLAHLRAVGRTGRGWPAWPSADSPG